MSRAGAEATHSQGIAGLLRYVLLLVVAFIASGVLAQELPPLKEFANPEDARIRQPKPISDAGKGRAPGYQLGAGFEADMRAAAENASRAGAYPFDSKTLLIMNDECERIAHTVYRLHMYAHARAVQAAQARNARDLDYNAPMGAAHGARIGFRNTGNSVHWSREALSSANRIPPERLLKQMSPQDLRNMLTDAGLEEYGRRGFLPVDTTLDTVLKLPVPAYKVLSADYLTSDCISRCRRSRWSECNSCALHGLEYTERWYKTFAAEWNAANRWYQYHRRFELTRQFVELFGE